VSEPSGTSRTPESRTRLPFVVPRRFLTFAVLLALVPVAGYFVAYMYELGYAQFFEIDEAQIAVTSGAIAAASLRLLLGVALVLGIFNATVNFGLERTRFRSREVMYVYTLAEAFIIGAVAFGFAQMTLRSAAIAVAFVLVATVLVVLAIYSSGPGEGFWARTRVAIDEPEGPTLISPVFRLIGSGYFPIVVAAIVLPLYAYWLGGADARNQDTFVTLASEPRTVVLRFYGDTLVASRVAEDGTLGRSRLVLRLGERPADEFVQSDIGPLRP
jgi:hypothetical protein